MSQQILDYASPGRGGRFRVGARSIIRIVEGPNRSLKILETLENRGLAAILIGVDLVLIMLMFSGLGPQWRRFQARHSIDGLVFFTVVVAIAMLTAIVYVIKHNWASTTIAASADEGLTLTFRDPFSKKGYHLPLLSILQITVTQSDVKGQNELLLLGEKMEMRLFTAHPWAELERIRVMLATSLAEEEIPVAALAVELPPYAQLVE